MCSVVDVAIQLKHFKSYGSIEWNAKHTSKQKNLNLAATRKFYFIGSALTQASLNKSIFVFRHEIL